MDANEMSRAILFAALIAALTGIKFTLPEGTVIKIPGLITFIHSFHKMTSIDTADGGRRMKRPTDLQSMMLSILASQEGGLDAEGIMSIRRDRYDAPISKGGLHNSMQKMVSENWVKHTKCKSKIGSHTVYYNSYLITQTGREALREVREFYVNLAC